MKQPKKTKIELKDDVYKVSAKVLGKTYQCVGKTVFDALSNLNVGNCKGKVILSVEHNDVKMDRILMPVIAFRLLNSSGLMKQVAVKNASLLFQGL